MAVTIAAVQAQVRPASRPGADPVVDLLRELVTEVRGLRQDLRDRDLPCQPDEGQFLATVAAAVAGHVFSAAELREHATVDVELRRALGPLTSQQVGIKLRALAGRDVGGYVVRRVGRDADGVVWAVQLSTDLHAEAGVDVRDGA